MGPEMVNSKPEHEPSIFTRYLCPCVAIISDSVYRLCFCSRTDSASYYDYRIFASGQLEPSERQVLVRQNALLIAHFDVPRCGFALTDGIVKFVDGNFKELDSLTTPYLYGTNQPLLIFMIDRHSV